MFNFSAWAARLLGIALAVSAVSLLGGCASGVTRPEGAAASHRLAVDQKLKPATLTVTQGVKASLDDNIKFNPDVLLDMINRRLELNGMKADTATLAIEIVIKDVRVRSTAAAVLFGFMAGDDRIVGDVYLKDASGRFLDRFEVSASYALGGWAGGQDGMRMSWLYEEFSKVLVGELRVGPVVTGNRVQDRNSQNVESPQPPPGPSAGATAAPAPAAVPQNPPPVAIAAAAPSAPASATLPPAGAIFRYLWAEKKYSRRAQEFEIKVTGVDGWTVMESFSVEGGRPARYENGAQSLVFTSRLLAESQTMVEFAPYLEPRGDSSFRIADPSGYSTDAMGGAWSISVQTRGHEQVTVPAGTFKALRIEAQGSRSIFNSVATSGAAGRFEFIAWYVPELGRYVKSRHQTWNSARLQIGDEQVELLEYRPR